LKDMGVGTGVGVGATGSSKVGAGVGTLGEPHAARRIAAPIKKMPVIKNVRLLKRDVFSMLISCLCLGVLLL
jgi:hypothetical protein